MRFSNSFVRSTSIFSEKFEFNNETESASTIFDDAHLYKKDSSIGSSL